MTHLLTSTILALLIGASPTVGPISQAAPKTDDVTVAGCLQKGTSTEAFTLMTDTRSYVVTGYSDLGKHVGHQVEITGTLGIDSKGDSKLEVRALRLITSSCSAPAL